MKEGKNPKFLLNEKLIVKNKEDFFLSRCIHIKKTKDTYKYRIHYINWSQIWDEWLTDDVIFKMTVETFERLDMDPPKKAVLPTEAELLKTQESLFAKMSFVKKQKSDTSKSDTSKSDTSKLDMSEVPTLSKKSKKRKMAGTSKPSTPDKKTKKMSSQDDDAVLVDESDDDETLFLDGVKSSQMFKTPSVRKRTPTRKRLTSKAGKKSEEKADNSKKAKKVKKNVMAEKLTPNQSSRSSFRTPPSSAESFKTAETKLISRFLDESESSETEIEESPKSAKSPSTSKQVRRSGSGSKKSTSSPVKRTQLKSEAKEESHRKPGPASKRLFLGRTKSPKRVRPCPSSKKNVRSSPKMAVRPSPILKKAARPCPSSKKTVLQSPSSKTIVRPSPKHVLQSPSSKKTVLQSQSAKRVRPCPSSKKNVQLSDGESTDTSGEIVFNRKFFTLKFPDAFNSILVNDYDLVHFQNSLARIPSTKPVKKILEEFQNSFESKNSVAAETVHFLQGSFDRLLDSRLLYSKERAWFDAVFDADATSASDVFGGIHFLRYLATLQNVLNDNYVAQMTSEEIIRIEKVLYKLLQFLEENRKILFSQENNYVQI